jgi:hypothetical protein
VGNATLATPTEPSWAIIGPFRENCGMRRALLSLVAGLVVAVATGLGTGEYLVAVVCGVAASLLTGLVSFSTFVKNILDGTKTFYEILAKKCVFRRSRSRFRDDGNHHSGMMPITIGAKRRWLIL